MAKGKKTGGRVAGTPNKATAEIKDIARGYGPAAIERLWSLVESSDSDAAKVSAIKEILDRGYGKVAQSHEVTGSNGNPLEAAIRVTIVRPGET